MDKPTTQITEEMHTSAWDAFYASSRQAGEGYGHAVRLAVEAAFAARPTEPDVEAAPAAWLYDVPEASADDCLRRSVGKEASISALSGCGLSLVGDKHSITEVEWLQADRERLKVLSERSSSELDAVRREGRAAALEEAAALCAARHRGQSHHEFVEAQHCAAQIRAELASVDASREQLNRWADLYKLRRIEGETDLALRDRIIDFLAPSHLLAETESASKSWPDSAWR